MIARDEEEHISDALRSILTQSRPPDTIALVDDGSKDRTGEIMRAFADENPQIKPHLIVTPGLGRAASSNLGARSMLEYVDIIVIADADDVSLPHRLARVEEFFLNNPEDEIHAGQMQTIDGLGREFGRPTSYPTEHELARQMLRRGRTALPHAAAAFRVSALRRLLLRSGFTYHPHMKRVQDLEILTALGSEAKFRTANAVDVLYRSDTVDRSFRQWIDYRPWHHFAIWHGRARFDPSVVTDFETWRKSLSTMQRFRNLNILHFTYGRLSSLLSR